MQGAQMPDGMADPVSERRAIQVDALANVNLGLAINGDATTGSAAASFLSWEPIHQ
jgi:hypothetical protein